MFGVAHSFYLFVFLKSIGVGFVIGALWFLFQVFRRLVSCGKLWVMLQDLLFFTAAAFITFLFLLEINAGVLRFYLFAGEAIGFCLFCFLPARAFLNAVAAVRERAIRAIKRCSLRLAGAFRKKINKKSKKNEKKLLQEP